jgi:iron complex outermembrane receptor protein
MPSAAIERIETITGGASAVYGADALAGVINFVLSAPTPHGDATGRPQSRRHGLGFLRRLGTAFLCGCSDEFLIA